VLADAPELSWFSPQHWREQDALTGSATGRGEAYFIVRPDGAHWVLRHYRRGGALARINQDRYLFTGVNRSRPVRELRLLAQLAAQRLPVPTPVAAHAIRRGPSYQADLITLEIPGSQTLADRLMERAIGPDRWQAIGSLIARFHRAGVWHADLNARNILMDDNAQFHLIDFDRARLRRNGSWRQANLARLRRSLDKFAAQVPNFAFAEADWHACLRGYTRGAG
jgi:3-deoxy-D-manno-octulosonic acid kinase